MLADVFIKKSPTVIKINATRVNNNSYMKTITNYSRYLIDRDGDIYSTITNKFLKLSVMPSGYQKVTLRNDNEEAATFLVHRLVWEVFNGPIPEGMTINHISEDKTDNRLDNLELLTMKENCNYR